MLSISAIDGMADEVNLNFMNISTKEGLSSNTLNDMLKDRYGFMWFATADGLNKFDGKHFTVYRHNATDAKSIASNEISDLYEDQKGNLWIATNTSLMLYNRKLDSFIDYTAGQNMFITSLSSDASGMIWIASYDGISILNPKTKKIERPKLKSAEDRLLAKKLFSRFTETKETGCGWVLKRFVSIRK